MPPYTPDPTDLVAEYLFEKPKGKTVENTDDPGPLDGKIVEGDTYPLEADESDMPPNFQGAASLDFDVLQRAGSASNVSSEDAQYVVVDKEEDDDEEFPHLDEMTAEVWVKVDYLKGDEKGAGAYPDRLAGFGACPQPLCKDCSWYFFLSTLQTDRNLMFTHIPNGVTKGLPKPKGKPAAECPVKNPDTAETTEPCSNQPAEPGDGPGGVISEDIVEGNVWTHLAVTFEKRGDDQYRMRLYINGAESVTETITDACGNPLEYPRETDNAITKASGTPLRIGMFREVHDNLDYQYSGKLCGVRIYSRPLTRKEICTDIQADVGTPEVTPPMAQKVDFPGIPADETHAASAVFEVRNPCGRVTLEIGEPTVDEGLGDFTRPLGDTVSVEPSHAFDETQQARVWIGHEAPSRAGKTTKGTVTVTVKETGEEFTLDLEATSTDPPRVAVGMALDQSGSMDEPSGLGDPLERRLDVLRFSAQPFVELLEDDDAVGIVGFDQESHPVRSMTQADATGKPRIRGSITGLDNNDLGLTAIGDGLEAAQGLVDGVADGDYDSKAVLVLTDGHETAGKYIDDVDDEVHDTVYAVGLGTARQVQPSALGAAAGDSGGYLLMTGNLEDRDFLLAKFFLQILTSTKGEEIVSDPQGTLGPGQEATHAFHLNETDIRADVILLSPSPDAFRWKLETPEGDTLTPGDAHTSSDAEFVQADGSEYYRLGLPLATGDGAGPGRWKAHLEGDAKWFADREEDGPGQAAHGVPFSLNVHSRSDLRLDARMHQDSREPGARLLPRAELTEYRIPVEARADVHAEVHRPDGTETSASFDEVQPGVFETEDTARIPGVHRYRVVASGRTLEGRPFRREQTVTAAVWQGGDDPPPSSHRGAPAVRRQVCDLLTCLLDGDAVGPELRETWRERGFDVDAARECLAHYCDEEIPEDPQQRDLVRDLREDPLEVVTDLFDDLAGPSDG